MPEGRVNCSPAMAGRTSDDTRRVYREETTKNEAKNRSCDPPKADCEYGRFLLGWLGILSSETDSEDFTICFWLIKPGNNSFCIPLKLLWRTIRKEFAPFTVQHFPSPEVYSLASKERVYMIASPFGNNSKDGLFYKRERIIFIAQKCISLGRQIEMAGCQPAKDSVGGPGYSLRREIFSSSLRVFRKKFQANRLDSE